MNLKKIRPLFFVKFFLKKNYLDRVCLKTDLNFLRYCNKIYLKNGINDSQTSSDLIKLKN